MTAAPAQLLVFGFGAGEWQFEGRLAGALERAESGGALRILRALFVGREAAGGELAVIDLRGGAAGLVAPLLDFRLDPARRRKATEEALAAHPTGGPREALEELGALLEPGTAVVAILIEHTWLGVLSDAVGRSGGTTLADEAASGDATADFARRVVEVASRWMRA
jgi:hypothetical protein